MNIMTLTIILCREILWFVLSPFRLIFVIKLRALVVFFCQYNCGHEFDRFYRLFLVARSIAPFWVPIKLIFVNKLCVSVVFLSMR